MDMIALITLLAWPVVPLFWVPVHCFPETFGKIGLLTYLLPLVLWLPAAYFILHYSTVILRYRTELPFWTSVAGLYLFFAGAGLQIWTGKLLKLSGLAGLPEIKRDIKSRLVTGGPFSVVRHPTYLSHTLMFLGVFLFTEVTAVGIMTLLDFAVVNAVIIPLEDRELTRRFGDEYREYRKNVPAFFPRIPGGRKKNSS